MWKTKAIINKHQLIKYKSPNYVNISNIFNNTKIGQIYLIGLNNNLLWSNGMNYEHLLSYDSQNKTINCESSLVSKNSSLSNYYRGDYILYKNGNYTPYITTSNIIKGYVLINCDFLVAEGNTYFDIYINDTFIYNVDSQKADLRTEPIGFHEVLVFFDFSYSENGFKLEIRNAKNINKDIRLKRIDHFKSMKVNIDNMFLVYNKI